MYAFVVYLTAMAIMAGVRSPAQLKANLKNGLLSMQKVSWIVSPLSMTFAQNFLPQTTWVPFFNFVAFGKENKLFIKFVSNFYFA